MLLSQVIKTLIVGYGSIGRRHEQILQTMGGKVALVTSQDVSHCESFRSLDRALAKFQPQYVIIASPTSRHVSDLEVLWTKNFRGCILIEKPVCLESELGRVLNLLPMGNARIHVGYNLRFSPVVRAAQTFVNSEQVLIAEFKALSYLPNWRNNISYEDSSSAKQALGGGVLRDLSHEIDLARWLLGPLHLKYSWSEKLSGLAIDTDDFLDTIFSAERARHVRVTLSYFDRNPTREIRLIAAHSSFQGDLNKCCYSINGTTVEFPDSTDETYRQMHHAVLAGDSSQLCSLHDGLKVVELVNLCRQYSEERQFRT